jgi:uncharacterized membrane protein
MEAAGCVFGLAFPFQSAGSLSLFLSQPESQVSSNFGMMLNPGSQECPAPAQDNIDTIVHLEEEALKRRCLSDKMADAVASFVGSVPFVALHIVWFAIWVAINRGMVPFLKAFDPYPFALLCMIVSLEGVLLSTFVLIKQNRMGQRADHRSHLDLQINLLSEKEITKVIQMLEGISSRLGIQDQVVDSEVKELGRNTAVENLSRQLEQKIPNS